MNVKPNFTPATVTPGKSYEFEAGSGSGGFVPQYSAWPRVIDTDAGYGLSAFTTDVG